MVHDMAKEIEDIKREAADLVTDQEVSKEMTFNTYNLSFQSLCHSARFSDFSQRIFLPFILLPFKITTL